MIKNCAKTAEILPSVDEIVNKADNVCPVQWAVGVAELAMKNSCGKGTFCRDGLKQLYLIGKDVTMNKGTMDDIELLQELCQTMYVAADCELSGKAIELYKASLDNHYNEWTAHVLRKKCKAGACTAFPKPKVAGLDLMGGGTTQNRRRKAAAPAEEAAPAATRRRRNTGTVVVEDDKPAAVTAAPVFDIPAGEEPAAPAARVAVPVLDLPEGGRRRRREKKVEIVED